MESVAFRAAASCQGLAGGASCSDDCLRNSWSGSYPCTIRTSGASASRQQFFGGRLFLTAKQSCVASRLSARSYSAHASATLEATFGKPCFDQPCIRDCDIGNRRSVEHWVEESVHEIVRNIQEAPFLQYVFDTKGRLGRPERQKVSHDLFKNPEYWPIIRDALSKAAPDGIILVQNLDPESTPNCCLAEAFPSAAGSPVVAGCPLHADGAETNVWGVLVQAKSVDMHACYLLKTTRVCSSSGICTRYCLTRAKCFGPSQIEQLESTWLL